MSQAVGCASCCSGVFNYFLSDRYTKEIEPDEDRSPRNSFTTKDEKEKEEKKRKRLQEKERHKSENVLFQRRAKSLGKVPLFKQLPRNLDPMLASACEEVVFSRGDVVIKHGTVGEDLFVISDGEAEVLTEDNSQAAVLVAGDYFGERALLLEEPHADTVKALTRLECCKMSRSKFLELGLAERVRFADRSRRPAVRDGEEDEPTAREPTPKTDAQRSFIADVIRRNETLQALLELTDERVSLMVDVARCETVAEGENLTIAGRLRADCLYVIQEGCFEITPLPEAQQIERQTTESFWLERAVTASRGNLTPSDASTRSLKSQISPQAFHTPRDDEQSNMLYAGASFGELELLYSQPCNATVCAQTPAIVWVVDRKSFKDVLRQQSIEKLKEYNTYLEQLDLLNSLHKHERMDVAEALEEVHFTEGEIIFREGEHGSHFYILYEGAVSISKDGRFLRSEQSRPGQRKGVFFGERALMEDQVRSATVTVTSPEATVLRLGRADFEILLGPIQDSIERMRRKTTCFDSDDASPNRLSRVSRDSQRRSRASTMFQYSFNFEDHIHQSDLKSVGLLGCGGFGTVELVEHTSGKTFALKKLSKGMIVKSKLQERTTNEKEVMLMTDSPFIVKLYECYADLQYLYFLLEPVLGGELYATYKREQFYGSIPHAKFYSASVVLAFDHLHERRIIYRDLKPENLLLTSKGNLKLTDMGLARFCVGKTFSTVGTPEYFGPEMILTAGHTKAIDWWTFGILMYELIAGRSPFAAKKPIDIYKRVMRGIEHVSVPNSFDKDAFDLVSLCLQKDPTHRLPMKLGGVDNIKTHKWYVGLDWEALRKGVLGPPYKPKVRHVKDLSNFRARPENAPKFVEYFDDGSGWDEDWSTV